MQKTLGGDRLGAGKKMKVNLHGYERSTHDMGYLWRSTMAAGTLVPFLCEVGLPGDTFDIGLNCDIKTHPTIGPLFGSYKVQLDVFQAPIRLYNGYLHNNALNIGRNMSQIKLPLITMDVMPKDEDANDKDNEQINPSCILSYLGLRGIGTNNEETNSLRKFNTIPLLAYWEIYKQYYANKQEEIGVVIHTPIIANVTTVDTPILIESTIYGTQNVELAPPTLGPVILMMGDAIEVPYTGATPIPTQIMFETEELGAIQISTLGTFTDAGTHLALGAYAGQLGTLNVIAWRYITGSDLTNEAPVLTTFPLTNIDQARMDILQWATIGTAIEIPTDINYAPYAYLPGITNSRYHTTQSQEGLAIKTYQSDLFNNWIETEWIDGAGGISEITSIDTTGGSFTIDTLVLSRKVYNMLNRIAISGGTYDDWLDVTYDHDRYQRCENPMYMGGLIKELVFQEVVSNSESSSGQPLGTLAGKGILAKKHKGGHVTVKVDEPSYIIGIISLTPRIDYSQGNKWDVNLKTLDDLHKPALDEIGFQELITEQMAWWDTTYDAVSDTWIQKSAGKQPAWLNYMTNVNQTRGNFAITTNEMFMTLNRRYEQNETTGAIADMTTYIDPSKYNFIFAETAIDAQNFWAQIAVDMTVRRKMSAKLMPNL